MNQRAYAKISMTIHDFDIDGVVYTPAEFGEKLGISVQTVNRWDRSGVYVANRIVVNNRTYKYYTEQQYLDFIESDMYFGLNHIKNRDLIGEEIGKLEILGFSESAVRKGYYGSYVCKCDCGNVIELARSELLSGKHKSCGCRFHDLTGQDFGRWHVDGIAPCTYTPGGFKLFQYYCTCECGTQRIVTARSLTSGASQSCGCRHKDMLTDMFLNDLTDKEFGDLKVVSRADTYWSPSGRSMRSMWNCVCQRCDSTLVVSSDNLISGRIDSCGCNMDGLGPHQGESKCESWVRRYLESIGLFDGESDGFIQYKTYPDLIGIGGGYLSYDFLVIHSGKSWLIECQGAQHYKVVPWFGGQAYFEKQQEHDRRKRLYAEQIGVPLIEIPYTCTGYENIVSLLRDSGIE